MMRINVRVIPRAKKERVEQFGKGLKVYVNAPASEGKANKRLGKLMSTHFKVRKSSFKIIKGEKSRDKVVEIE